MVVFIDGACATIAKGQRQGSWGIYWRNNSLRNKSGLCQYPLHTNNRAEAEALLRVLVEHRCSNYSKWPLVVASDLAYVCNSINDYRKDWQWYKVPRTPDIAIISHANEVVTLIYGRGL